MRRASVLIVLLLALAACDQSAFTTPWPPTVDYAGRTWTRTEMTEPFATWTGRYYVLPNDETIRLLDVRDAHGKLIAQIMACPNPAGGWHEHGLATFYTGSGSITKNYVDGKLVEPTEVRDGSPK